MNISGTRALKNRIDLLQIFKLSCVFLGVFADLC